MAQKDQKLKARLPRGLADRTAVDIRATERMVATIRSVYERYGFEPVETPLIEYTDALGKFLPDQDRPNEGVFSFQDDDEQWLSLRYDLTAPLARYVAENFDRLAKPYRSYRAGWVFRNEKPGPGRFRQFMQFDADTVGTASPAADAEMCMMAADALEALGIPRGQYVIKVNSRKVLDGVMEAIGLGGEENAGRRLEVLRAVDKRDRLGLQGIRDLLGTGRRDESGDFTKGVGLKADQIEVLLTFVAPAKTYSTPISPFGPFSVAPFRPLDDMRSEITADGEKFCDDPIKRLDAWSDALAAFPTGSDGVRTLRELINLTEAAGYGSQRITIDTSVVRGLEYYTGAIFEAELLFQIPNERGQPVVFGSVGGGGRYDGLVGRFRGEDVPATGFSIGVSRLQAALKALGKLDDADNAGPVVMTVMEQERIGDYQRMVSALRNAGISAELYLGSGRFGAQMKYADRRNAPLAIIQGSDEKAKGVVQIKDLALGKRLAADVGDNTAWREERPGQFEVPEAELVEAVKRLIEGRG